MVSVSRNTVNRWEIGGRQPSMQMIEKLASAFKVTIQALLRDRFVPVKVLSFNAANAFSITQPFTVPLIGLMMAVDDARHLQKLLIISREKVEDDPEVEKRILNGEMAHLFRLVSGHLQEAKSAFLDLEKRSPRLADAAVGANVEGKAALARVRRFYQEKPSKHRKVFIDAVRNFVAFHYNPVMLKRALEKHAAAGHLDGTLIVSPHSGIGRFEMTDGLATLLLSDELGGQVGAFQKAFLEKVGEVVGLVGDLGRVVNHLLGWVLLKKGAQPVNTEDAVVRVDPLIERARRKIVAMRQSRARARSRFSSL
jgi:transcriptional regulator with XRE-family HTH domain